MSTETKETKVNTKKRKASTKKGSEKKSKKARKGEKKTRKPILYKPKITPAKYYVDLLHYGSENSNVTAEDLEREFGVTKLHKMVQDKPNDGIVQFETADGLDAFVGLSRRSFSSEEDQEAAFDLINEAQEILNFDRKPDLAQNEMDVSIHTTPREQVAIPICFGCKEELDGQGNCVNEKCERQGESMK
jgi:hypothetical protein